MADKRFYWLKLKEDFFSSKEIKKLRKMSDGDTYVIIYLKMQLHSLKDNGKLYFEGIDDDFASEIALEIDEDVEKVKTTISFLEHCNLIESVSSDEYFLPTIPDVTGSETKWAEYKRKSKSLENGKGKLENIQSISNKTLEKLPLEKEKEKDIDIDIERRERDREKRETIDYQRIVDMYNDTCVSFPHLKVLSENRKKTIKARLNSGYTYEDFQNLFTKAENSSFLKGSNDRNWSATFDWLIKDSNMAKVLEGNYDERNNYYGENNKERGNGDLQQPNEQNKYGSWF